jgi:hypothetical protein
VDHFDYTLDEKKSHFAIWSSLSAPLIISAWIPDFTAEEIEYLTNRDIIAVNQDPLALQATLVSQDGTWDVLTKSLANGDRLLTIINRGNFTGSLNVPFARIGLPSLPAVQVKDLWTGTSSLAYKEVIAPNIPSHGTAVLRISIVGGGGCEYIPTGMIFNTYSLTVLTSSQQGLSWANATAVDGQVWQTKSDGTITSLADTEGCLTDLGNGLVSITECSGAINQKWEYLYEGNVVSKSSKLCLTEGVDEEVVIATCGYETNAQVFGLPSGVDIIGS